MPVAVKTDQKPQGRRDGFAVRAGSRFHLGRRAEHSQRGLGSAQQLHNFSSAPPGQADLGEMLDLESWLLNQPVAVASIWQTLFR